MKTYDIRFGDKHYFSIEADKIEFNNLRQTIFSKETGIKDFDGNVKYEIVAIIPKETL